MIRRLAYLESTKTDPYYNLALEEYLLLHVGQQECILYLWQNKRTVVIGKNQNAWKECLTEKLQQDGGHLVRRLSGGGTVFHDLGNLNFTFLVQESDYDFKKQLEVIIRAVKRFGIEAVKTGRNDITVNGKKFSGNAFFQTGQFCYHHGTLMVQVDLDHLSDYLNVPLEKLQSKGVASVRSRVANLSQFSHDITIPKLKTALVLAFEEVYGLKVNRLFGERIGEDLIRPSIDRFSSWDWIYGKKLSFQYEHSGRFPWGDISFLWQINSGKVEDCAVYSDAMAPDLISKLPKLLKGNPFRKELLLCSLDQLKGRDEAENAILYDIRSFLNQQMQ